MAGARKGFVVVPRSLQDTWVWIEGRAQDFLDMVMYAVHTDCYVDFLGARVELKRGHLLTTDRVLAKRWSHWRKTSRSSVDRFLKRLEETGNIERRTVTVPGTRYGTATATLIRIVNYDTYQLLRDPATAVSGESWDTPRDEEGASRKDAAAALRVREESGTPDMLDSSPPSDVLPEWVLNAPGAVERRTGRWPRHSREDLKAVASLTDLGLSPASIMVRIGQIAERQAKKRRVPNSLNYYTKAIAGDVASLRQSDSQKRLAELARGVGPGSRHPASGDGSHRGAARPVAALVSAVSKTPEDSSGGDPGELQTEAGVASGLGGLRAALGLGLPPTPPNTKTAPAGSARKTERSAAECGPLERGGGPAGPAKPRPRRRRAAVTQ